MTRADLRQRLPVAAVVVAGALLLAWAALREMVLRALPPAMPVVRMVGGDDPRLLTGSPTILTLQSITRPIDADSRRRLAATLQQLPLADEPFVAEARGAFRDGDLDRSIRLLEEARRRAPRNRAARLLLLDHYARADRLPEAVGEAATLNRLVPEVADVLVPLLSRIAVDPRGVVPVRRALAADPVLANAVLGQMAGDGAEPDAVLALARGLRTRTGQGRGDWHERLVVAVVARGDYRLGHALWARFNRVTDTAPVFDETLRGATAGPPFGWKTADEGVGAVDWRRTGGVDISYYGRQSGTLMTQMLTLSPGRYRLRYQLDAPVTATGSGLVWRVRCVSGDRPVVELPVARAAAVAAFAVGRGCPAQSLSLDGVANEFPQAIDTTLRRISVLAAGSAR